VARKAPRGVSHKPEHQVREAIDPFEELTFRYAAGTKMAPASSRIPESLLSTVDQYTHDPRFPWKNRSEFIASAIFRLLEDVQKIERNPLFDESLAKMRTIMTILQQEEEGRTLMTNAQKIISTIQAVLMDGDTADAKRMLAEIKQQAEGMTNRRWREKIMRTLAAFGSLVE